MSGWAPPGVSIAADLDGRPIKRFELVNDHRMSVAVLEYGAIIQAIRVPDRGGRIDNVALGLATVDEYVGDRSYFGAVVGRFANRIENGWFVLDGRRHQVTVNEPPSSVHGGASGFNRKVWNGTPFVTSEAAGVRMGYLSPAGEEGFPGNLEVEVGYELLRHENTIRFSYSATTDAPTIVNLTNHSFLNLDGEGAGTILDHVVTIHSDGYLPLSSTMIPTGDVARVSSTPLDFRIPKTIGARVKSTYPQIALVGGYDHNFVVRRAESGLAHALTMESAVSGRSVEVWTTEPAIDFYSGNYFDGSVIGVGGAPYERWAGVAIEPEHVSNSPNLPAFPSTTLRPGETYASLTEFRFGVVGSDGEFTVAETSGYDRG